MTVLVALHISGAGTWLGADTRTLCGGSIFPPMARKIIRHGTSALMMSGDGFMSTLVARHKRAVFASVEVDKVAAALVKIQTQNDFKSRSDSSGSPSWGQCFIYATPAGVWDLDGAGSWLAVPSGGLWARGSGSDYALGCDHGLMACRPRLKVTPKERIEHALAAACAFDSGCAPPFQIEHLK